MPKKKLPTGPIRIDTPTPKPLEEGVSSPDARKQETRKQDSGNLESGKRESPIPEASQPESRLQSDQSPEQKQDSEIPKNRKQDSSKQETTKPESTMKEASTQYNPTQAQQQQDSTKPETSKPESRKQDSGLQEYKKVAMRLSVEAVERLRQFRSETGIPYEILVDVMVRNWEDLPQRTQSAYLKQAQQARNERLLTGQEKAMKTMRKRLSDEG